MIEEIFICVL